MSNILFISDNESFSKDLSEQITFYAEGFNVYTQDDGETMFDVVILDDKPELLKGIHKKKPKIPIFQLLSCGLDDCETSNLNICINKPLSLDGFLNQLRSGIHLLENSADGYLHFNHYELRPANKEILNQRNDELTKLTEKEVAIIKYLYKAKDKIISKNELLQEVWGYSPEVTTHTIETHIYRLRQKVEHDTPDAQLIMTEEGGYKLKI